tara:strand:- start:1408 stop:1938 length:531 start_codon:yes stop_codon:yes gene_type:complete
MSKFTKRQQIYTLGFKYKCGLCKKESRQFKNESGMKMWSRLHFKKNKDCGAHHKKFGLGNGFNNTFTDGNGKKHHTGSARSGKGCEFKMPKTTGHQKADKKVRLEDTQRREAYLLKAIEDENYLKQIQKDLAIPKKSITLECRICGDFGYYEDIKDDDDDFEFGTCAECEDGSDDE